MEKSNKFIGFKKWLPLLCSPLAAAAAVLIVFWRFELYPFGTRTAAWCDMNQQVVPLLCQFKDILDGKSGMFLSFKNASGMNFWGVFFFFLSSPLTFLVKFVEKSDMLLFANILILLKMMLCAFTASLYFIRSPEHKELGAVNISLLGFIYSVSGYVMLFYQNVIWLDMMYLFPLLLISLNRLRSGSSPLMYIIVMAFMMTVNYYIGYMIVIFVLLLAAAYVLLTARLKGETTGAVCRRFIIGSGCSALLSAAVWLPCFLQYLTSGRRSSLIENLRTGELVTDYDTVFPVMMCCAFMLLTAFGDILFVRKRSRTHKLWLIMFLLMCVPVVIEPINKMWHTGSYMSFPARYAFMTIFMGIILCAYMLEKKYKYRNSIKLYALGGLICAAAILLYERVSSGFINEYIDILSNYTKSLGGSEASFKGLCRLLIVSMLCVGTIYFVYRKGWVFKGIFTVFLCAAVAIESLGYIRIYMTTAAERSESTNQLQREVFDLADRIDDDGFYRVKTSAKIFDYNMIGAMGYNSIGHYTSLTDEDYMFTMKRMGYTSVWMEVGTCGGTELTDALLSIGYEISHEKTDDSIYTFRGYSINPTASSLPLGVISDSAFENADIPAQMTRAEVQQYIFREIFGSSEQLIYEYEPSEGEITHLSGVYTAAEEDQLIYRVSVEGKQTLYFDCFDKLTNDLSEPIYDSFSVYVNGKPISRSYPYSKENGVLKLGEFEDEKVVIEVNALKDVSCASFGVFGLDTELLESKCAEIRSVGLSEKKNGLTGSVETEKASTVFLAVPYEDGFDIKVNGKSVDYREALSGFIAFDLPGGKCDIEITFRPVGLMTGAVLGICGIAATAVYLILRKRIKPKDETVRRADKAFMYTAAIAGAAAFLMIYVLPPALNIILWKKE